MLPSSAQKHQFVVRQSLKVEALLIQLLRTDAANRDFGQPGQANRFLRIHSNRSARAPLAGRECYGDFSPTITRSDGMASHP